MEFWFLNCCLFEQSQNKTISLPCGETRHSSEIELQQTAFGEAPHPNSYLHVEISNNFSIKTFVTRPICITYFWIFFSGLLHVNSTSYSLSPFPSHHSSPTIPQHCSNNAHEQPVHLRGPTYYLGTYSFMSFSLGCPFFSQVIGIYKIEFLIF